MSGARSGSAMRRRRFARRAAEAAIAAAERGLRQTVASSSPLALSMTSRSE